MHTTPIIVTVATLAVAFAVPWIRIQGERRRMPTIDAMTCRAPIPSASGIGSVIAAIIARTASGSTAIDAFQEQFGARFATPRITADRAAAMLRRHASGEDTEHDIIRIARHLASACALSERLGCEAHRCLQSVSDSYRRECKARDLRKEAFAAPKATIRLMSALPLATVALGEFMGAHPIAFLLGSSAGMACLVGGLVWYGLGLLWIRRLFEQFQEDCRTEQPVPLILEMIGAAIAQGAPIPTALAAVGSALEEDRVRDPERGCGKDLSGEHRKGQGKDLAAVLRHAGESLLGQVAWREAWIGACAIVRPSRQRHPSHARAAPTCSDGPAERRRQPLQGNAGKSCGTIAGRHTPVGNGNGKGKNDSIRTGKIGSESDKESNRTEESRSKKGNEHGRGGKGTRERKSTGKHNSIGNISGCGGASKDGSTDIGRQAMLIANCLEAAWHHGASPLPQLHVAVMEHERAERSAIEQSAARLSIQLLSPTGLCFLPAFILIGIVPTIASFTT